MDHNNYNKKSKLKQKTNFWNNGIVRLLWISILVLGITTIIDLIQLNNKLILTSSSSSSFDSNNIQHYINNDDIINKQQLQQLQQQQQQQQIQQQQQQRKETKKRTIHILYCLNNNGNNNNNNKFITNWEISFKSLILNIPIEYYNIHIHIISGSEYITELILLLINKHHFSNTKWKNQFTITIHTISKTTIVEITNYLKKVLSNNQNYHIIKEFVIDKRIGIGGYFRLFSHKLLLLNNTTTTTTISTTTTTTTTTHYDSIIGNNNDNNNDNNNNNNNNDLKQVIYLDTDVIIMSNLNHLIVTIDTIIKKRKRKNKQNTKTNALNNNSNNSTYPLWMWGQQQNSGFLILNTIEFQQFWNIAEQIPSIGDYNNNNNNNNNNNIGNNKNNNNNKKIMKFKLKNQYKSDQWILTQVEKNYYKTITSTTTTTTTTNNNNNTKISEYLPKTWSTHLGHDKYRSSPQLLYNDIIQYNHTIGYLHFSGYDKQIIYTSDKYCIRAKRCNSNNNNNNNNKTNNNKNNNTSTNVTATTTTTTTTTITTTTKTAVSTAINDLDKVRNTWGLVDYYIRIPWSLVLYQGGISKIPINEDGYIFQLQQTIV